MHSRATDRRSASKCQGKWPDQTLDQAFGLPEALVAVSTSRLSCKRAGKTRTLMPVRDSSGESRLKLTVHLDHSVGANHGKCQKYRLGDLRSRPCDLAFWLRDCRPRLRIWEGATPW